MTSPYQITILNGMAGLLMKRMAGKLVKKNREKPSSNGEIPSNPTLITTKLKPHTTITSKTNVKCNRFMYFFSIDLFRNLASVDFEGLYEPSF